MTTRVHGCWIVGGSSHVCQDGTKGCTRDHYQIDAPELPEPCDADLDRMTAHECFSHLQRTMVGGEAAILKAVAMTRAHERRKWIK